MHGLQACLFKYVSVAAFRIYLHGYEDVDKRVIGGHALKSWKLHCWSWKIMEKSWNCVFEFLWEPCINAKGGLLLLPWVYYDMMLSNEKQQHHVTNIFLNHTDPFSAEKPKVDESPAQVWKLSTMDINMFLKLYCFFLQQRNQRWMNQQLRCGSCPLWRWICF